METKEQITAEDAWAEFISSLDKEVEEFKQATVAAMKERHGKEPAAKVGPSPFADRKPT